MANLTYRDHDELVIEIFREMWIIRITGIDSWEVDKLVKIVGYSGLFVRHVVQLGVVFDTKIDFADLFWHFCC